MPTSDKVTSELAGIDRMTACLPAGFVRLTVISFLAAFMIA